LALADKGAVIAGDVVGGFRIAVLDRDLNVIKPCLVQLSEPLGGEANARSDEIGVEAGEVGGGSDVDEIAPCRRLTAGEMNLQHPEPGRLVEHACPRRLIKLRLPRLERERIGAVGTTERAPMRELRQETERP